MKTSAEEMRVNQQSLFGGLGAMRIYYPGRIPVGTLRVPYGSGWALKWAMCGQWSLAALMGCSMDYIHSAWPERLPIKNGSDASEMAHVIRRFATAAAYSTEKARGPFSHLVEHVDELPITIAWPVVGLVAVTLPDQSGHWVATLNGEVFDCLQGNIMHADEWITATRPEKITDVIVVSPAILRRDWRWRMSANENHLNGGF